MSNEHRYRVGSRSSALSLAIIPICKADAANRSRASKLKETSTTTSYAQPCSRRRWCSRRLSTIDNQRGKEARRIPPRWAATRLRKATKRLPYSESTYRNSVAYGRACLRDAADRSRARPHRKEDLQRDHRLEISFGVHGESIPRAPWRTPIMETQEINIDRAERCGSQGSSSAIRVQAQTGSVGQLAHQSVHQNGHDTEHRTVVSGASTTIPQPNGREPMP